MSPKTVNRLDVSIDRIIRAVNEPKGPGRYVLINARLIDLAAT